MESASRPPRPSLDETARAAAQDVLHALAPHDAAHGAAHAAEHAAEHAAALGGPDQPAQNALDMCPQAPAVTALVAASVTTSVATSVAAAPDTQVSPPSLLARLRALIAPHCTVCGLRAAAAPASPTPPASSLAPLCAGCRRDFFAPASRCTQCGLRLAQGGRCGRCLREQPAYDATVALADYMPPVDGLVVALKFGHRLELATLFGNLLAERLAPLARADTLLLPVPLAFERQAERGFNQAHEIARVAQRRLRCTLRDDILLRTRHCAPQEALKAEARRRNVRKAFAVRATSQAEVAGRAVIVLDDVMTSGATLDEVARVLKQAGAVRVTNAIVARTP